MNKDHGQCPQCDGPTVERNAALWCDRCRMTCCEGAAQADERACNFRVVPSRMTADEARRIADYLSAYENRRDR